MNNFIAKIKVNDWAYIVLANIPVVNDLVVTLKCKQVAAEVAQGIATMQTNKQPADWEIKDLRKKNETLSRIPVQMQKWAYVHAVALWALVSIKIAIGVMPVAHAVTIAVFGIYLMSHFLYLDSLRRQYRKINSENADKIFNLTSKLAEEVQNARRQRGDDIVASLEKVFSIWPGSQKA